MLLTVTKQCLRWKPRRFSEKQVIRVTPDNKREGQGCAFPFSFSVPRPTFQARHQTSHSHGLLSIILVWKTETCLFIITYCIAAGSEFTVDGDIQMYGQMKTM